MSQKITKSSKRELQNELTSELTKLPGDYYVDVRRLKSGDWKAVIVEHDS